MKTPLCSMMMIFSSIALGDCRVSLSNGAAAPAFSDALSAVLHSAPACPRDVRELKSLLATRGLKSLPSMVANRGFHNPSLGSFSFFERVTGPGVEESQFFFGHFTEVKNGLLSLAQEPEPGALMIELIAWDSRKGLYNFYELIGAKPAPQWFYRGDSADILADNRLVYRTNGAPQFGNRLRCSGCHSGGGPIMKELRSPHNDWWLKERPLPLGRNIPSPEVKGIMAQLQGADEFARKVKEGIGDLEFSPNFMRIKASRSLQEQLRPIFCETEINLASDVSPLDANQGVVNIPIDFLANSFLVNAAYPIPKAAYLAQVSAHGMKFPETMRSDGDHAFLTPVRSFGDAASVSQLLHQRIVDDEFVADVFAVDMENPLFSKDRCSLLKAVPNAPSTNWKLQLIANLRAMKTPAALVLLENLTSPAKTAAFHRQQASLMARRKISNVDSLFRRLLDVRAATAVSEISQNPRGRILEPGFRVIFPVPNR